MPIRLFSILILLFNLLCAADKIRVLIYDGPAASISWKENHLQISGNTVKSPSGEVQFKNNQAHFVTSKYIIFRGGNYTGDFLVQKKDSRIQLIHKLEFEDYLAGVLLGEISPDWPKEAIAAQAVAARSYAVLTRQRRKKELWQIEATTAHQVFKGTYKLPASLKDAVARTRGEVLNHAGHVVETFFTACCGGETELASEVWNPLKGSESPWIKSIRCPWCAGHPKFAWKAEFKDDEISAKLGKYLKPGETLSRLKLDSFTQSKRVRTVSLSSGTNTYLIGGNVMRMALAPEKLLSLRFTMTHISNKVFFEGTGFGHGVGLCQWGAKTLAEKDFDYRFILKYYYKDCQIVKM